MFVHLLGALKFDTSGGLMPRISYIMTESAVPVGALEMLPKISFPLELSLRPPSPSHLHVAHGTTRSSVLSPLGSCMECSMAGHAHGETAVQKRNNRSPQGWEDGTPPPHRDFKSTIFPLAFAVCPRPTPL